MVLLVFFLFFMSIPSANAVISMPIDAYKVSCYPALKEFRVETSIVPWADEEQWATSLEQYELYPLNKHHDKIPKPITRRKRCRFNGKTYTLKFIPYLSAGSDNEYDMSVQLFEDDTYLGKLKPFGYDDYNSIDAFGIKNDKIFMQGYASQGADKTKNIYTYKEINISRKTSDLLQLLSEAPNKETQNNTVELQCYDKLPYPVGKISFHSYPDDIMLPENYYRFENEVSFDCGNITFKLDKDNSAIYVIQNSKTKTIKLNNCHKSLISLQFNPHEKEFNLNITYYDQRDKYWRGTHCFSDMDCMTCEIYH